MTSTGSETSGGVFGLGVFSTLTNRINQLQESVVDSTMGITRFAAGKIREFKDAFTGSGEAPEGGTSSTTSLPASHLKALDNLRMNKPIQYRRMVNQLKDGGGDASKEVALWLSTVA